MFEHDLTSITKPKVMHITYDMRIGGTEMVIKNIIDGCDKDHFEMSILIKNLDDLYSSLLSSNL